MDRLSGLPSKYFHDEELKGARVRLLTDQPVGQGHSLMRGECFVVAGVARKSQAVKGIIRKERLLYLTNHRAKMVPIRDVCCELLFEWPQHKAEGNRHGQAS